MSNTNGAHAGTPIREGTSRTCNRLVTPVTQINGRELAAWLGGLTLTGGDLDGQKFSVWPWERRFLMGTFAQPGNAALSIARGNGKSAFVAALAAAVVVPGGPLHGTRREVDLCRQPPSSKAASYYEDVLEPTLAGLGHDMG